MEVDEIVEDFIRHWRPVVRDERRFFENRPNLREAIRTAALCERPDGKRESHQRRLSRQVLEEAECLLQTKSTRLKSAKSFSILHSEIANVVREIDGIGDLAIYDIATRIGAFLRLRPAEIFLHAGAALGAKRLGLRGDVIHRDELPPEFTPLDADEIETVLCIYKDCFPGGAHAKHSATFCFSSVKPPCGGGRRTC